MRRAWPWLAVGAREQANSRLPWTAFRSFGLLSLLQLGRALVAIPPVATGGIGTGAAIAAVLVESAGKPDAIADEAGAGAEPDDPPARATLSSRTGAGASCPCSKRELDAFRVGHYVPIINQYCWYEGR